MSEPLPTRPLLPWTGNGELAALIQNQLPTIEWERDLVGGYDSFGRKLDTEPTIRRFRPFYITYDHEAYSLKVGDECVVEGIRFIVAHLSNQWVKRCFWGIEIATTLTVQPFEVPRTEA